MCGVKLRGVFTPRALTRSFRAGDTIVWICVRSNPAPRSLDFSQRFSIHSCWPDCPTLPSNPTQRPRNSRERFGLDAHTLQHRDEQQRKRFREAVEDKKASDEQSRRGGREGTIEQDELIEPGRTPDTRDPRAKNSGHGKKTADKWNQ